MAHTIDTPMYLSETASAGWVLACQSGDARFTPRQFVALAGRSAR
jgi:hypothetical protein